MTLPDGYGSGRGSPIHPFEYAASRFRHGPLLQRHEWLWRVMRPAYEAVLWALYPRGIEWVINGTDRIVVSPHWRTTADVHEPEIWRSLMGELRPDDTVADVGAGIGTYTLAIAKRLGPLGRVVALEPDASNFKWLKIHVALNRVGNKVELMNCVAGDHDGEVEFLTDLGALSRVRPESSTRTRRVRSVRLDRVFATRPLQLLVMDVEGYEGKVLEGAAHLLRDSRRAPRTLYIELHHRFWGETGTNGQSIQELLTQSGYRLTTLDGQPVERLEGLWDVVARRIS